MKKIMSLMIAIFMLTGIAIGAPYDKVHTEKGYITVSATSTDEVSPNIAQVIFYVETEDRNQNVAVENNNKIASKVIETVKKNINNETDTVKTLNYSVSPNYVYSGNKRTFDKYVVTNSIEVKTKNPKNMAVVIDEALKAGATRVSGLTYTLDYEKFDYSALINEAVKTAKDRADVTANALGVKIVGLKNIATSCGSENSTRYFYMNVAKSAGSDAVNSSSHNETGLVEVKASVNVEFWVK